MGTKQRAAAAAAARNSTICVFGVVHIYMYDALLCPLQNLTSLRRNFKRKEEVCVPLMMRLFVRTRPSPPDPYNSA